MPVIVSALFCWTIHAKWLDWRTISVARTVKNSNDYCWVKYLCKLDVCLPISSRIILHDLDWDSFTCLEVCLSVFHPSYYNICSLHFALTAGDAKSYPSCRLRLNSEDNFLFCNAHIPVQLDILVFVKRRKKRMVCSKIGRGRLHCKWTEKENPLCD